MATDVPPNGPSRRSRKPSGTKRRQAVPGQPPPDAAVTAVAALQPQLCPDCDTRRIGSFRFCLSCGFDFDERAGPADNPPAGPTWSVATTWGRLRGVVRGLPAALVRLSVDALEGYRFGLIGWIIWVLVVWLVIAAVAAVILAIVG